MAPLELYPQQKALIERVSEAFRAGYRNVMVCAPCGFGKTETAVAMLAKTRENGRRGAFICDRIALIDQTSARFDKYGLPHGIMQAQHFRWQPQEQIQVCSIQTLIRRQWPDSELMVCDEAHVLPEAMREKLLARKSRAVGLSATPVTPGLGKYFDIVINAATTNQLIADEKLTPYRIFACTEPNMDGVKVTAGEWQDSEASKRALEVVGDCVVEYLKHGNGQKFIAFAVDVAHAEELQRQFMASGVVTATYTYRDSDEDRAQVVAEFRKADSYIRGVISVESLTRGFDVADIGVLILARPLRKALAVHLQMMGRVMRTAPGKTEALILDHSGNCTRFWDEMNEIYENGVLELDDGKKKKKPKKAEADLEDSMMKCPQCRHLHPPRPFCPACGHQYPKKEAVKHVPGTLTELVASGDRRAMSAKLWPQIVSYAKQKRETDEAAKKLALALFKRMTDQWPVTPFEKTEPLPLTIDVLNKIRSMNIAYARAKQKRGGQK